MRKGEKTLQTRKGHESGGVEHFSLLNRMKNMKRRRTRALARREWAYVVCKAKAKLKGL
jgi:hypothetical protein